MRCSTLIMAYENLFRPETSENRLGVGDHLGDDVAGGNDLRNRAHDLTSGVALAARIDPVVVIIAAEVKRSVVAVTSPTGRESSRSVGSASYRSVVSFWITRIVLPLKAREMTVSSSRASSMRS